MLREDYKEAYKNLALVHLKLKNNDTAREFAKKALELDSEDYQIPYIIGTAYTAKKEYEKDKICILCGSIFHSEKKNVTHCSQKCVGVTRRKAKEDNKIKGKATEKSKGMTITEIAVAARKEHLTYGQYVIKYGL